MFLDKKSNFDVPHIKNNISQLRSLANKEPHIKSYLIIFFIREENLSLTKQGQYLLLSRALGNFPKYYLYLFSVIARQNHLLVNV